MRRQARNSSGLWDPTAGTSNLCLIVIITARRTVGSSYRLPHLKSSRRRGPTSSTRDTATNMLSGSNGTTRVLRSPTYLGSVSSLRDNTLLANRSSRAKWGEGGALEEEVLSVRFDFHSLILGFTFLQTPHQTKQRLNLSPRSQPICVRAR